MVMFVAIVNWEGERRDHKENNIRRQPGAMPNAYNALTSPGNRTARVIPDFNSAHRKPEYKRQDAH